MNKYKVAVSNYAQLKWLEENYPEHVFLGMRTMDFIDNYHYNGYAHLECTPVDAAIIALELCTRVLESDR